MSKDIKYCSCDCKEWIENMGKFKTDVLFTYCPFCGSYILRKIAVDNSVDKLEVNYPNGDQYLINLGK